MRPDWQEYLKQNQLEDDQLARILAKSLEDPGRAFIGWFKKAMAALEEDQQRGNGVWKAYEKNGQLTYKEIRQAIKTWKKRHRPSKEVKPPPPPPSPVPAKYALTIRIDTLPRTKLVQNGWRRFQIKCDRRIIYVTVRPKVWKRMQDADAKYPSWMAKIGGRVGKRVRGGFELEQPGIQIFERKAPRE